MKHSKFSWIAAFAFSALAAVALIGCGKQKAAGQADGTGPSGSSVYDKTTARLEKGGIAFSFTDGASAYRMVDLMFDSFNGLIPSDVPKAKSIFEAIRNFVGDEFGLKTFLGSGTSVTKNGDYYRCIDFEYAPEHKGLFWDMLGANESKGQAPELKLASPKSAVAVSGKVEPGALYAFVDSKLRAMLDESAMAAIDEQLSALQNAGIQPDKLLECISGITFYVEGREYTQEDIQAALSDEDAASIATKLIPKFAIVFTTKSDLCWKALENFISQSSPELVQDGRIVPVDGFAVFQAGNYLVATNDEAAIRDRIAGKGSDLTSNAEFAKMLALAGKDFSGFSWASEDYYKMIAGFVSMANAAEDGADNAADPSLLFMQGFHSILCTAQVDPEGLTFTTITPDLQVALLNSGTVAGVVSGILPYIGPIVKLIVESADTAKKAIVDADDEPEIQP